MIDIYTDGSAVVHETNKGKGGMSVVFVINDGVRKVISRGYIKTKTGRMELIAALTALKVLKKDQKAVIHPDSMYVVNTFNERWIYRWRDNGWSCKNSDIMKELIKEYEKFPKGNIKFKHVKGHNGNVYNELADALANYKNFTKFIEDNEQA